MKKIISLTLLFSFAFTRLTAQKFLPPAGKQLLIIGQDLEAVKNYVTTKRFPVPAGHTTYINLFAVNDSSGPHPFGGLGEDRSGKPVADVDWGAGKINAHNSAFDPLYINTALVIGLYMNAGKEKFSGVERGDADAEIIRLGEFIKRVNKPVYLRIAYEFEGNWNASYADPVIYKAAFRRVTEVLRKQQVNNFATVWQTSASPLDDIEEKKHENIEDWYPGDDVVDWMAISWFLNPSYQAVHSGIKITQGELAEELLALARKHHKPVMIAESATQGYDLKNLVKKNIAAILDGTPGQASKQLTAKQIWTDWFQPYFDFINKNSDVVRAVAYINADWDSQSMWGAPYGNGCYWGNSQVQENEYISEQWRKQITRKNWLHGSGKLFWMLDVSK